MTTLANTTDNVVVFALFCPPSEQSERLQTSEIMYTALIWR